MERKNMNPQQVDQLIAGSQQKTGCAAGAAAFGVGVRKV